MSDIQEIKQIFNATEKAVADLRTEVEAIKGKSADVVTAEKLDRATAEIATRLEAEQKASAERIEKLEVELAKAKLGDVKADKNTDEYKSVFIEYTRGKRSEDEIKAMSTDSGPDGGVLVTETMATAIQARLRRSSPVRAVANVVTLSGAYKVPVERGEAGSGWVGERQTRAETATPTIDVISIAQHELSAKPKITQNMLDDTAFDVEAFLQSRIAEKFERDEGAAFVAGDGLNKPKGFLAYSTAAVADETRSSETLEFVITGANGAFDSTNPADVLIDAFYKLQSAYQANASWMMKNTVAAAVAKIKDGDGSYLLQGILNADGAVARTIQGRPLFLADAMPLAGTGSLSIAVGDFGAGYTINDGPGVRVLRDPYSAKPFVEFYTTKRVGGGVTDFDAIKLIKFSAA